MTDEGILQMGDQITGIDGNKISEADDLISYVEQKKSGDIITLDVERDDEQLTEEITLETFEEKNDKIGVGIQLGTKRNLRRGPERRFSSGGNGGPRPRLQFLMEIYD